MTSPISSWSCCSKLKTQLCVTILIKYMFFRNDEIVSYHYQINSSTKYYDETSFCVSGKTSNMLDNRIARKSDFGYENSQQKVRISCCSNYHTKSLYKPVCQLWGISIFHPPQKNQIRWIYTVSVFRPFFYVFASPWQSMRFFIRIFMCPYPH